MPQRWLWLLVTCIWSPTLSSVNADFGLVSVPVAVGAAVLSGGVYKFAKVGFGARCPIVGLIVRMNMVRDVMICSLRLFTHCM